MHIIKLGTLLVATRANNVDNQMFVKGKSLYFEDKYDTHGHCESKESRDQRVSEE